MGARRFIMLLFLSLIFTPSLSGADQPSPEWAGHYAQPYNFSFDTTFRSFISAIPLWEEMLSPFKGKPDVHYLEVGVNQGRSAMWVLENILTHPSATLTGIDIFPEGTDFKEKYLSNVTLSGCAQKVTTVEGFSQIELRKLPLGGFDIIYIDGDHRADGVLADAVLSFALLKTGGVLIFDDYLWFAGHVPEDLRPQIAIDSFITTYRNSIEVIHRGYQIFIKKRERPCEQLTVPPIGCSAVGQYVYVWNWSGENELYPRDSDVPITLSARERHIIEGLITSTKFGRTEFFLDSAMAQDRDFVQLCDRLKLDLTSVEREPEKSFFETVKDKVCAPSRE